VEKGKERKEEVEVKKGRGKKKEKRERREGGVEGIFSGREGVRKFFLCFLS